MQAQPIKAYDFIAEGDYGYAYNPSWDNDPAEELVHEEVFKFKGVVYAKNETRAEELIYREDFKPDWAGAITHITLKEFEEDEDELNFCGEGVMDYNEIN